MGRATVVIAVIAAFLVGSLLIPYDDHNPSEAVRSETVRSPRMGPPGPMEFSLPNEWGADYERELFQGATDLVPSAGAPATWDFQPSPGSRVLPGTWKLNITYRITDPRGEPGRASLTWLSPNDMTGYIHLMGADKTSLIVPPHAWDYAPDPDSRWIFQVRSHELVPLRVSVALHIQRQQVVPGVFTESAYTRWGSGDSFVAWTRTGALLDAGPRPEASNQATSPPTQLTPRAMPWTNVSYVRVEFRYNSSTPPDQHYRPLLKWHGADRAFNEWEQVNLAPTKVSRQNVDGAFEWWLPVEPRMWESPFAKSSRWRVHVNWQGNTLDTPVLMEGNYRIVIEAIRGPLSGVA